MMARFAAVHRVCSWHFADGVDHLPMTTAIRRQRTLFEASSFEISDHRDPMTLLDPILPKRPILR